MLTALNVELCAQNNGTLPYSNSLFINGLFYSFIKENNPVLSEKVHTLNGLKPYTLSMLQASKNIKWELNIYEGSHYNYRVTLMEDVLVRAFYETILLYFKKQKVVRIGKINFLIKKLNLERSESFYDIVTKNKIINKGFEINFFSPTSFRVDRRNYLFPDAKYVLRSYFDKWNSFCPTNLKINTEELTEMIKSCFPVKHNIYTELFDMGNYKVVGFKGKCCFELDKNIENEYLQKLSWLLHFCRYSGTGYKTTMGMGQTQVFFI